MLRSMQPLIRSSSVSTAPSRPRYCGNWPQTPVIGIAYGWVPAFRWQFWQARLLPAKRFARSNDGCQDQDSSGIGANARRAFVSLATSEPQADNPPKRFGFRLAPRVIRVDAYD